MIERMGEVSVPALRGINLTIHLGSSWRSWGRRGRENLP
jgi:hypothetical protein